MTRLPAILTALGLGIAVVAVAFGTESLANDGFTLRGFIDSLPYFLILALWIAVPFLILALARVRARAPWIAGVALTVAAWAFFFFAAYALTDPAEGANIGLGMLAMVSPVIITVICVAIAFARPKRDSSEETPS